MLIQRLTIKQLGRPLFFCIHRVSAKLPEFFLLAHFVRCGGDSFNLHLAILLHSQSIRITSGVFPPRSLRSLWRRLLQLCGLVCDRACSNSCQSSANTSNRSGVAADVWNLLAMCELTLYPWDDPRG